VWVSRRTQPGQDPDVELEPTSLPKSAMFSFIFEKELRTLGLTAATSKTWNRRNDPAHRSVQIFIE
jgi:hypothetical protein